MAHEDLTKPLAEVPVGAHVAHERRPCRVIAHGVPLGTRLHPYPSEFEQSRDVALDTRVLHLEGSEPRLLSECVGRDVWCAEDDEAWTYALYWADDGSADPWWRTPRGTLVSFNPDSPSFGARDYWPIIPTGWAPPEPEQERLYWYDVLAGCLPAGNHHPHGITVALAEHDYAVVDLLDLEGTLDVARGLIADGHDCWSPADLGRAELALTRLLDALDPEAGDG